MRSIIARICACRGSSSDERQNLTELILVDTPITGAGLEHLRAMPAAGIRGTENSGINRLIDLIGFLPYTRSRPTNVLRPKRLPSGVFHNLESRRWHLGLHSDPIGTQALP